MLKWFVYIVFLLVSAPGSLLANTTKSKGIHAAFYIEPVYWDHHTGNTADTTKTNKLAAKPELKVKEVPKPKRQPKPEKIDDAADAKKVKPKRQRRPDGMDRPPEIPRRNDN